MRRFLLITLIGVLLTSCSKDRTIEVIGVTGVNRVELSSTGVTIEAVALVDNSFKGNIVLKDAEFTISTFDGILAVIRLEEKVKILGDSQNNYIIPIRIRSSLRSILGLSTKLKELDHIMLEGSAKGRKGLLEKRFKFNRQITKDELGNILKILDLTDLKLRF